MSSRKHVVCADSLGPGSPTCQGMGGTLLGSRVPDTSQGQHASRPPGEAVRPAALPSLYASSLVRPSARTQALKLSVYRVSGPRLGLGVPHGMTLSWPHGPDRCRVSQE